MTLGDYVDRGPDSRGVIDLLIEVGKSCCLIPILGNHEEMMLDSRQDNYAFDRWMHDGGEQALNSYGGNILAAVPDEHWEFLESCRSYHESDDFIFVHANYQWHLALDQQPSPLLRWISINDEPPQPHVSGKKVILGHQPGKIRDCGHFLCIDTGCGFGGLLTAVEVETGQYWQVKESGDVICA